MNDTAKRETDFSKITSIDDLILYLDDASKRLQNRKYIYHYTTLKSANKIFEGKLWHLGNAKFMNDILEYDNGDEDRWKNIFFSSFMTDGKESIGMWSMYSQPWKDGVMLMIPEKIAREWVKNIGEILEISREDYKPTGNSINIDSKNKLFLSSVAYSNCDNPEIDERITWSTAGNHLIKNAAHRPELTGYIKDSAWDYEREIRIKATLADGHGFERAAINVPKVVLDSIEIVGGPLFEKDLNDRLYKKDNKTSYSLFYKKLSIENICINCSSRRSEVET